MSHPNGGKGAFNYMYVETALTKVLKCFYGMGGPTMT